MTLTTNDILTTDTDKTLEDGIQYIHPFTKIHETINNNGTYQYNEIVFDNLEDADLFNIDLYLEDVEDIDKDFYTNNGNTVTINNKYKDIEISYEYNNWGIASVLINQIMYPHLLNTDIRLYSLLGDKKTELFNYNQVIKIFNSLIKSANITIDTDYLVDKVKQRKLYYLQYACNLLYYAIENL